MFRALFKAVCAVSLLAFLSLSSPAAASSAPAPETNWSGPYRSCGHRTELLKSSHMELGVRFDTSNGDITAAPVNDALDLFEVFL